MNVATDIDADLVAAVAPYLVAGFSVSDLARQAEFASLESSRIEVAASQLRNSPLLGIARQLRTRLEARNWFLGARADVAQYAVRPALAVRTDITRGEFLQDFYAENRPLLLRQVAADWPAVKRWDGLFFTSVLGRLPVEVMSGRTSASVPEWNTAPRLKTMMPMSSFVERVYSEGPSNDYYMVSRNHFFRS